MKTRYEALTKEGERLKARLALCVRYAELVGDLEEERRDIRGLGLPEESIMTAQLREWRQDWERRRRAAATMISETEALTSLERRILRLRYLCAAPWDSICAQVHREHSGVYAAYRRALNKMAAADSIAAALPEKMEQSA